MKNIIEQKLNKVKDRIKAYPVITATQIPSYCYDEGYKDALEEILNSLVDAEDKNV